MGAAVPACNGQDDLIKAADEAAVDSAATAAFDAAKKPSRDA